MNLVSNGCPGNSYCYISTFLNIVFKCTFVAGIIAPFLSHVIKQQLCIQDQILDILASTKIYRV